MTSLFISYRRQDASTHIARLRSALEKKFGRSQIFTDIADILPGDDFLVQIKKSLSKCDVILVVIGPDWLPLLHEHLRKEGSTDYAAAEVLTALNSHMKVVPVLVDGAEMPRRRQLPKSLRPLSRRNAVTLHDETWDKDAARLAKYLDGAQFQVSSKRGFRPKWLVPVTALFAPLAWTAAAVVCAVLLAMSGHRALELDGSLLRFTLTSGVVSGLVVGFAHWFLLRGSRIVIKRSLWLRTIAVWSALSLLAPTIVLFLKDKNPRIFVPALALVPFLVGAFLGLKIARKLRMTDPSLTRKAALVSAMSWATAIYVGAGAAFTFLEPPQEVQAASDGGKQILEYSTGLMAGLSELSEDANHLATELLGVNEHLDAVFLSEQDVAYALFHDQAVKLSLAEDDTWPSNEGESIPLLRLLEDGSSTGQGELGESLEAVWARHFDAALKWHGRLYLFREDVCAVYDNDNALVSSPAATSELWPGQVAEEGSPALYRRSNEPVKAAFAGPGGVAYLLRGGMFFQYRKPDDQTGIELIGPLDDKVILNKLKLKASGWGKRVDAAVFREGMLYLFRGSFLNGISMCVGSFDGETFNYLEHRSFESSHDSETHSH